MLEQRLRDIESKGIISKKHPIPDEVMKPSEESLCNKDILVSQVEETPSTSEVLDIYEDF